VPSDFNNGVLKENGVKTARQEPALFRDAIRRSSSIVSKARDTNFYLTESN